MKRNNQDHLALGLLKNLISECNRAMMPLVLIRPRDMTADCAYKGDYDFLLPLIYRIEFLRKLHEMAAVCGLSFSVNQIKKAKLVVYVEDSEDRRIKLELWSHLDVRDPRHRTMRYIEWVDVVPYVAQTEDGYRLDAGVELLYYLSHLYSKNKDLNHHEVQSRLAYYRRNTNLQHKTYLCLLDLLEQTGSTERAALEANNMLCEIGILKHRNTFMLRIRDIITAKKQHLHANCMSRYAHVRSVAVLGPDGSGKTTFIKRITSGEIPIRRTYVFKWLFRNSLLYKLTYPVLQRTLAAKLKRKVKRNQVDDHFGMFMLLLSLLNYLQLRIRSFLVGRYFIDRYYYDLLLKNLRFSGRDNKPRKWWRAWLCIIPRPAWYIQLDAPVSCILDRKKGIKEQDIIDMRNWHFEFYLAKPSPWYSYINTTNTLEENYSTAQYVASKLPECAGIKCRK